MSGKYNWGAKGESLFIWAIGLIFLLVSLSLWGEAQTRSQKPEVRKQISKLKKRAENYFKGADFGLAIFYYQDALKLAKDDPELNSRIAESQKKLEEQKALRTELPKETKKKEKFLNQKYKQAKELYSDDKLEEARKEFYELWLLAGKFYRTLSYLEKIDKRLEERRREMEKQKRKEEEKKQAETNKKKERAGKLVKKAEKYLQSNKLDKAINYYNEALRLDKENKLAQEGLEKAKKEKEQLQLAEKKETERQRQIESHLEKGRTFFKAEKYQDALNEFQALLQLDKTHKQAQQYTNKCTEKIKEIKRVEEEAQRKQRQIVEGLKQAQELMEKGSYEAALAQYEQVLARDKNNKEALTGQDKARQLITAKREKEEEAKRQREAEEEKARKVEKFVEKGEAALKAGELEKAIENFNEALKIAPGDKTAKAALEKSQALKQEKEKKELELAAAKKEKEEAKKPKEEVRPEPEQKEKEKEELKEIERIKREQQKRVEELTAKGKALYERGRYEEALKYFEEALKLHPLYAEAVEYKKKTEEKIAEAKRLELQRLEEEKRKKEAKEKAESLYAEAQRYHREKQFDLAEKQLKEALNVLPGWEKATALLKEVEEAKKAAVREKAMRLVDEGKRLFDKGKYLEAVEKFKEALKIDPTNEESPRCITLCQQRIEEQRREEEQRQLETRKSEAKRLFHEGVSAYRQKKLAEAVSNWEEALRLYPELEEAKIYLEETREEYRQYVAARAQKEEFERKEESAEKKLNTLVSMVTKKPIPLRDFVKNLYIITDVDFYVAEGVEASVEVKFEDKPLREVLDAVLLPIGLKWERKPGSDIIIISPDLRTRVFELTPAQLTKIKSLMDNKFIQRMLWGAGAEPSLKGVELTLDERESVLIMVDSKDNLQKMEAFMRDLQKEAPPELTWKSYKIEPQFADKIKAILEAMLEVEKPEPYSRERRIMISGDELVIKDTPENIKRAEEILMDRDFIKRIKEEKLLAEVFDITPAGASQENMAQVEEFGRYVSTVVENMLYAKTGKSAAEAEGRRLWLRSYIEPPDKPKLTLTVVDYPGNIEAVADVVARLPEVKKALRSEILYLKFAKAADMASYLESVLGIAPPPEVGVPGVPTAEQITKTMRVEDEVVFRDLSLRLIRVNQNDVANELDDDAEFYARTATTGQDITIEEFRSEFIDEYEIVAEDIRPAGRPGYGRVRVIIRYVPAARAPGAAAVTPTATPAVALAAELPPISIEPFEDLNALLLRYTDPAMYGEVKKWIEKLDLPTPQVSIESRFVEVLENRAREFSAEFTMLNIGEGVDLDSSVFNLRFGQFIDELRDELEPPLEYPEFANLLKGTTIFNWIIGGKSPINYQLRLLESEGIINIVSGPTVTVLSGESVDFIIERTFGLTPPPFPITPPTLVQVDITVTPTVTQLGSITLDIDADIRDFESSMGNVIYLQRPQAATGIGPRTIMATAPYTTQLSVIRKNIETRARVQDGGTIVLGGWTGERSGDYHSGVPILRNLPYIGQVLFGRNVRSIDKTTLLIFLTANIVK